MLNDFRQFQFALARHLRDPLSVPAPAGVDPVDVRACTQDMVDHLQEVLNPAFMTTRALLGEEIWAFALRLFLKDAPHHTPWASTTQRAFVDHVCESPAMQNLPAWLQDLAHFEWLQSAISTSPVQWPYCDRKGDVMHHAVVLNPTHVEAVYEWPVHRMSATYFPNDMQNIHLSLLRDTEDVLRVYESSVFRGQLLDLLRAGHTGKQALLAMADWLSHPSPEDLVREGATALAQLHSQGIVLGVRC